MRDLEVVCDRTLFLREGTVLAEGTAKNKQQFQSLDLDEASIKIARSERQEASDQ